MTIDTRHRHIAHARYAGWNFAAPRNRRPSRVSIEIHVTHNRPRLESYMHAVTARRIGTTPHTQNCSRNLAMCPCLPLRKRV
eukprot:1827733-Prymnesium_polylepis.1